MKIGVTMTIDQKLMIDVLLESKSRLTEIMRMIENSETESERTALVRASDELKKVIERNLT